MFTLPSMKSRRDRILYFIKGESPTEAEAAQAEAIGTRMFRNASQITKNDNPEQCDFVAGCVPAIYSDFPRADKPTVPVELDPVVPPSDIPPAGDPVVVDPPVVTDPPPPALPELPDDITVAELKTKLTELGVDIPSTARKQDLIDLYNGKRNEQ